MSSINGAFLFRRGTWLCSVLVLLNPEINIPGVFKEYTMYANVVLLRLNLHVPMKSAFKRVFTDREFTDEKTRKFFSLNSNT